MVGVSSVSFSGKQRTDNKNSRIKGGARIAAGGYLASKAITSGLCRTLGIRIEEHTTSLKNAKNIIKDGCILDPKYGGTGNAKAMSNYQEASKNFVHITGINKKPSDFIEKLSIGEGFEDLAKEQAEKFCNSPAFDFLRTGNRKLKRFVYRFFSDKNVIEQFESNPNPTFEDYKNIKNLPKAIFNAVTGIGSKTFYIPGTEEYFNNNFIADIDDTALKTDKPLKVCRTKIGAMFEGLKNHGLSGMKQNKARVIVGTVIFAALAAASYMLIKTGMEKFKDTKEDLHSA